MLLSNYSYFSMRFPLPPPRLVSTTQWNHPLNAHAHTHPCLSVVRFQPTDISDENPDTGDTLVESWWCFLSFVCFSLSHSNTHTHCQRDWTTSLCTETEESREDEEGRLSVWEGQRERWIEIDGGMWGWERTLTWRERERPEKYAGTHTCAHTHTHTETHYQVMVDYTH